MANSGWLAKVAAKGYADDMPENEYRTWLAEVAASLAEAARPGASFFFNHKLRWRDGEIFHPIEYVRDWPDWQLIQEIIWDRRCGFAFNCGLFAPSDERVYWLARKGARPTFNEGSARYLSVWDIPSNRTQKGSEKGHPCPFPLELASRCVSSTTSPDDLVLDPFAGSGTTGIAAIKAGRRCVLIEKDARYIPIILRRVAEARTPLFDRIANEDTDR